MGTEELPREYKIKLRTSTVLRTVSRPLYFLARDGKKRVKDNERYERYLTDRSS